MSHMDHCRPTFVSTNTLKSPDSMNATQNAQCDSEHNVTNSELTLWGLDWRPGLRVLVITIAQSKACLYCLTFHSSSWHPAWMLHHQRPTGRHLSYMTQETSTTWFSGLLILLLVNAIVHPQATEFYCWLYVYIFLWGILTAVYIL